VTVATDFDFWRKFGFYFSNTNVISYFRQFFAFCDEFSSTATSVGIICDQRCFEETLLPT